MAASHGAMLISNGNASSSLVDWPGGIAVFALVVGVWNGATVKLQLLAPDGQTLLDAGANTTFGNGSTNGFVNGMGVVYLPPCQIQATVSGGPPSGVYASIARMPQ